MNEQGARQELGIGADDSFNEIRKKYRILVKRYHPDKNPSSESLEKCKRVIEAYTILCDIKKQSKTPEELKMEQHIWNLFSEFWPIPQESPSSLNSGKIKKDISFRLEYKLSYWQFVRERGFYDFVSL